MDGPVAVRFPFGSMHAVITTVFKGEPRRITVTRERGMQETDRGVPAVFETRERMERLERVGRL